MKVGIRNFRNSARIWRRKIGDLEMKSKIRRGSMKWKDLNLESRLKQLKNAIQNSLADTNKSKNEYTDLKVRTEISKMKTT